MDPKNQLDPKLKEAYDRVMNAQFNPSQPQQPIAPHPQAPNQPLPQNPTNMQSTVTPIGSPQQPHPDFGHIEPPHQSFQNPNPTPPPASTAQAFSGFSNQNSKNGFEATIKTKKSNSPILIALGVIIFFALYTFIWIKIFNVSLPFLSSGTNNPLSGPNTVSAPTQSAPVQPLAPSAAPTTAPPADQTQNPPAQQGGPVIVTPPSAQQP